MGLADKFRKNEFFSFPIYNLTRNRRYMEYFKFFVQSESWSKEQLDEWQWKKINEIVTYAYSHVPFYKKIYSSIGFQPGDLKSWEDFEKLPFTTKNDFKKFESEFYTDELSSIISREDFTGGSTGQPMRFRIDNDLYYREDAVYRYYWGKSGFNVGKKCTVIRGQKVANLEINKFYEYNRFWNYMYLDSSYIKPEFFQYYDNAIKKFNAKYVQAYPSSLYLLARIYEIYGIEPPKFKNIYLGSENIYENQIYLIKKIFKPEKILNQYGHSEKVLLGLQEPLGSQMGFMPQYGYMELIDGTNKIIRKNDQLGEIVGTGYSKCMPFIRYKTSDCAKSIDSPQNGIMKNWRCVSKIEGRLHEFILTKDNRLVSICTIGGAHIKELNSVLDMQYEQKEIGNIIINVVENPNNKLSQINIDKIERKFENIFENQISCKLKIVNSISRSNRNKKSMLIQHLNVDGV